MNPPPSSCSRASRDFWKVSLVVGSILLRGGLAALATIDHTTTVWHMQVFVGVMGAGMGALMQNLVLARQNTVNERDITAASASIALFRTLGGAIGVSVLGAVLATRVQDGVTSGPIAHGPQAAAAAQQSGGTASLDLAATPAPVRATVGAAYGDATGDIVLIAAVVSVVAFVAVLFINEVPLRTSVSLEAGSPEAVEKSVAVQGEVLTGVASARRDTPSTGRHRYPRSITH